MFEIAKRFRQARVYGFDIDKPAFEKQVARRFKTELPRRFRFEEASALKPFPYDEAAFDFTHERCMSPFVPIGRWPQVIKEMIRMTRPGGYIESVETMFPVSTSPRYQFFAEAGLHLPRS
jgi:SAM-dependent methyltransferase